MLENKFCLQTKLDLKLGLSLASGLIDGWTRECGLLWRGPNLLIYTMLDPFHVHNAAEKTIDQDIRNFYLFARKVFLSAYISIFELKLFLHRPGSKDPHRRERKFTPCLYQLSSARIFQKNPCFHQFVAGYKNKV